MTGITPTLGTKPARRGQGFTLIELLVVISIIALLIGILLPALASARTAARQMTNNTQLRGIHQALFAHSQEQKGLYAGLSPTENARIFLSGAFTAEFPELVPSGGTIGNGNDNHARLGILVLENFLPAEYCISPAEPNEGRTPWVPGTDFTSSQVSYNLLRIEGRNNVPARENGRRREWRDTADGQVWIASDRLRSGTSAVTPESIWTEQGSEEWEGGLTWNDGHTAFQQTDVSETTRFLNQTNTDDKLFTDDEPSELQTGQIDARNGLMQE